MNKRQGLQLKYKIQILTNCSLKLESAEWEVYNLPCRVMAMDVLCVNVKENVKSKEIMLHEDMRMHLVLCTYDIVIFLT